MSGAAGVRFDPVVASARSLPARACRMTYVWKRYGREPLGGLLEARDA